MPEWGAMVGGLIALSGSSGEEGSVRMQLLLLAPSTMGHPPPPPLTLVPPTLTVTLAHSFRTLSLAPATMLLLWGFIATGWVGVGIIGADDPGHQPMAEFLYQLTRMAMEEDGGGKQPATDSSGPLTSFLGSLMGYNSMHEGGPKKSENRSKGVVVRRCSSSLPLFPLPSSSAQNQIAIMLSRGDPAVIVVGPPGCGKVRLS